MLACFSRYLTGSRSVQLQQGIACVIGKNWFEISQKSWHNGNMNNDQSTTLSMSHLNNFSYNQSSKLNKSIHTEHLNNSSYNQSSKWNKSILTETTQTASCVSMHKITNMIVSTQSTNNQTVPAIKFISIIYTTVLIGPIFSKQNSCTSSSISN